MALVQMTQDEWIDRYDSEKTRYNAMCAMKAWQKYLDAKGLKEDMVFSELKTDHPYLFLDNLVQFWKADKGSATIRNYFSFVRSWLRTQGIKTEDHEIKTYVKFPKAMRELKEPLTYDVIKKILEHCDERYSVLYLMLASSGMRTGECLALKINDIDLTKKPAWVHIRAETTKTKEERYTFLSAEAVERLRPFIEGRQPHEKIFDMTSGNVVDQMRELRKRAGLLDTYQNGVHKVTAHAFRAFFRTKAGFQNRDFAEKILGHRGYLGQYIRLEPEELAKEYVKIEKFVTVSQEKRYKEENEDLRDKVSEITELKKKVAMLEAAAFVKKKVTTK